MNPISRHRIVVSARRRPRGNDPLVFFPSHDDVPTNISQLESGLYHVLIFLVHCAWIALAFAMLFGCEPIVIESPGVEQAIPEAPPAIFHQEPDGKYKDCPSGKCPYQRGPINRLEKSLQSRNYGKVGSCAHAAVQDSLVAQGMVTLAADWRERYGGPAGLSDIRGIADKYNLDYAYTTTSDMEFLEWCSRTRRPACIFYRFSRKMHAITFIGFEGDYAVLQDNNRPGKEIRVPRGKFHVFWHMYGHECGYPGGVAFTIVGEPAPPRPILFAGVIP